MGAKSCTEPGSSLGFDGPGDNNNLANIANMKIHLFKLPQVFRKRIFTRLSLSVAGCTCSITKCCKLLDCFLKTFFQASYWWPCPKFCPAQNEADDDGAVQWMT